MATETLLTWEKRADEVRRETHVFLIVDSESGEVLEVQDYSYNKLKSLDWRIAFDLTSGN
jgi:hypothetical protein